jgi:hypothetical protein
MASPGKRERPAVPHGSVMGLGQRVFFLHDGRTSDLLDAIGAHRSSGSEANGVINNSMRLAHRSSRIS